VTSEESDHQEFTHRCHIIQKIGGKTKRKGKTSKGRKDKTGSPNVVIRTKGEEGERVGIEMELRVQGRDVIPKEPNA